MKKEFALIMVSCIIGVSSAYGDPQINIEESPGQTDHPFTITDDSSKVLFRVLSDGQAIIDEFIHFSGFGLTDLRTYVFPILSDAKFHKKLNWIMIHLSEF